MLVTILGVALMFVAINQAAVVEDHPRGYVYYDHPVPSGKIHERGIVVSPVSDFRYQNIVRQAYDYSCGSAAMTTILNQYLGRQFDERQIMEGLLRFGETERIVERRGFSLLDMKRLATALGHPSGGFRAKFDDLKKLDHPAIVPIHYGGFKHFVVLKEYRNGHVFVADPALGNISFTEVKFQEVWTDNVLFIIFPNGFEPQDGLALTEWDLRLVDERTLRHIVYQEFQQFTPPMENEADRAASLVRLRAEDEFGEQRVINVPTRTYYRRK